MDNHSKNVCLIGILHIMGYIVFTLQPISRVITMLTASEEEADSYGSETIFNLIAIGILLTLTILASLMIRGVKKQNYKLIAPFLIASVLILATMIIMFCAFMFGDLYGASFYGFLDLLYTMGVQIMSIYPIYTLFMELRSVAKKEKSLTQDTSDQQKKPFNGFIQNLCV